MKDKDLDRGVTPVHYGFSDTTHRDTFIESNWPERTCLDTPGFYAVDGGGTIQVWLSNIDDQAYRVDFYPQ